MENNKKTAQEMLDRIQSGKKETVKQERRKLNVKSFGAGLIVSLMIGGAGYMILQSLPSNQNVQQQARVTEKVETPSPSQYTVIDMPEWAKKPWDTLTDEEISQMVKDQEDSVIGWISEAFPSEKDGFTRNPKEEYDQDGLPNPYFSKTTKESFTKDMAFLVNRVVNPVFGNWVDSQIPTKDIHPLDIQSNIYRLLATRGYMDTIAEEPSKSVIFYDVNQDFYGGEIEPPKTKEQKNRFIGVVKTGDMTFDENGINITVKLDVDYLKGPDQVFKSKHIEMEVERQEDGSYLLAGGSIVDK